MRNCFSILHYINNKDIESLEKHFIYFFLEKEKINYQYNHYIKNYLKDFKVVDFLYDEINKLKLDDLKELENWLEKLIPDQDKKINGAFFTPEYIIDFIISEIAPGENDRNLDPACGSGAFLIGLAKYYKEKYHKTLRDILKENVFGSDILNYNINRAKLILIIYGLQNNENIEENDLNLWIRDSLTYNWEINFDNIVGNPPYVKLQDLSIETRNKINFHWQTLNSGSYNLYFAFFELGYKLLKESGKLGFITPNNYFTSLAGESLRMYFQNKECIYRILDFNHKKVFDVQTYTAITFLNKKRNKEIFYDRIKENQTPEKFLIEANGSANKISNLISKKWRLLKSDEQKNIESIENIGDSIGNLFDIVVGIATLKDDIFFIDGEKRDQKYYLKETQNGVFKIEKECTKSVFKISDIKSQNDIINNYRKIIFPYQLIKNKAFVIKEIDFIKNFPFCYEYLLSEKDKLEFRDKGKIKYDPFYSYGRTQGLTRIGIKIVTPTFSRYPRFMLIEDSFSYFTNGYGIFYKKTEFLSNMLFENKINRIANVENKDVLIKILNSNVMQYYISKTSVSIEGGYPCYQKNFIEKFTIPKLTQMEINTIRNLTEKLEIDDFLFELYQLKIPSPNLLS